MPPIGMTAPTLMASTKLPGTTHHPVVNSTTAIDSYRGEPITSNAVADLGLCMSLVCVGVASFFIRRPPKNISEPATPPSRPRARGLLGYTLAASIGLHALAVLVLPQLSPSCSVQRQKVPTQRDLTRKAQKVLENPDTRFRPPKDYDLFLLQVERYGGLNSKKFNFAHIWKEWKGEMDEAEEQLKAFSDPHEQISRLSTGLYVNYFQRYGRRFPQMADYFRDGRGNCVSQTELILAAVARTQIQLSAGEEFGIQVFGNHTQPVIYRKNDAGEIVEVHNLISGRRRDRVVAKIYAPTLLYATFLKMQGAPSPVSFDELLIATPKPEDVLREPNGVQGYDRNKVAHSFPPSEAISGANAPADAILPPPQFKFGLDIKEGYGSIPGRIVSKVSSSTGPYDNVKKHILLHVKRSDHISYDFTFWSAERLKRYRRLPTPQRRRDYVIKLWRLSLIGLQEHPSFKRALDLLADPAQLARLRRDEVWYFLRDTLELFRIGACFAARHEPSDKQLAGFYRAREEVLRGLSGSLDWLLFEQRARALNSHFSNHPEEIILLYNQLTNENYNVLPGQWTLIAVGQMDETDQHPPFWDAMIKLLLDTDRVKVSEKINEQSQFKDFKLPQSRPLGPKQTLIPIQLATDTGPAPSKEPKKGQHTPRDKVKPITVSPKTILDLATMFDIRVLFAHWGDTRVQQVYRERLKLSRGFNDYYFAGHAKMIVEKEMERSLGRNVTEAEILEELSSPTGSRYFPPPVVETLREIAGRRKDAFKSTKMAFFHPWTKSRLISELVWVREQNIKYRIEPDNVNSNRRELQAYQKYADEPWWCRKIGMPDD